jgi:hypothetical protein
MEYQVPQFIEVEDKIFGPLTWKQFIFMAGGIGLSVIIFLYLPFFIAFIAAIGVMALATALSFYKINNKNFVDILGAGFSYYTKGRLYLWRKEEKRESLPVAAPQPVPTRENIALSRGKLHDLALSLDIQDRKDQEQ